eukprot:TRINITY_DN6207_c0_g1_i1.p2 TRINITY_DN6207_c0_g1~~TRINITY_DN6207_c0_g1_i1.p2  ORF type:complete len:103 (-),score=3.17 TRINITY_DN6207_c0_g1_i1:792-1100(-)
MKPKKCTFLTPNDSSVFTDLPIVIPLPEAMRSSSSTNQYGKNSPVFRVIPSISRLPNIKIWERSGVVGSNTIPTCLVITPGNIFISNVARHLPGAANCQAEL